MLNDDKTKEIKNVVTRLQASATAKQIFSDYYKGNHQLNFASEKFKNKFGSRLQRLRENLCRTVVKAPASRLEIINFLSNRTDTENPAWAFWKREQMPLESGKVHRDAFKTGESFVIVWEVAGKAKVFVQNPANCAIWKSDETGETEKAAKLWQGADKKFYLTIYYRDRVEKYVSGGDAPEDFAPRVVAGEDFPLYHELNRVPVFQFTFDEESDGTNNSILTDVIPLNDALNKSWSDIIGAQEENMRRRRFVAGMQVETDEETGKKINPFKPDDDVWFANDDTTKFGEFSDADLKQMIAVKQECVKSIALVSAIPPSYFNLEFTGQAISGEALQKIEARFTAIIADAQRSFGETWAEVVACALEIERTQISEAIETQWTSPAPSTESDLLDNAVKKQALGWSVEQIQRDYGLTDAQIEKMKLETDAAQAANVATASKFFDAGNQPPLN